MAKVQIYEKKTITFAPSKTSLKTKKMKKITMLFLATIFVSNLLAQTTITPGYHGLAIEPLTQNWNTASLITANDNWDNDALISIRGFMGNNSAITTVVDPSAVLVDDNSSPFTANPVDVNANQTNPAVFNTGGVTEFAITDPAVALAGSGTADMPFLKIYLCTMGRSSIPVSFDLIDIDNSVDNSIQKISIQARIGNSGNYTEIMNVADASAGPSLTLTTPVSFTLPPGCNNKEKIEIRIMTGNAAGNDEWIAIDNIVIGQGTGFTPTTATVAGTYTGSYECVTPDGFTHYINNNGTASTFDDDLILLSIKKGTTGVAITPAQVTVGVLAAVANLSSAGFVSNTNGFYSIPRYWALSPSSPPAGTTVPLVRFYYTAADLAALNTTLAGLPNPGIVTDADITQYNFVNISGINPDPSSGHPGSALSDYQKLIHTFNNSQMGNYAEFATGNFLGGTAGGGGGGAGLGPLPVTLVSFEGKAKNNAVYLDWSTSSEINNAYFSVERSQNGVTFEAIGKVNGGGNSNEMLNYAFIDAKPVQGVGYYRLRQVDFDGRFGLSNVISLKSRSNNAYSVFPKITSDNFEILSNAPYKNLKLIDVTGRMVFETGYLTNYSIGHLAAGVYFIEIDGYKQIEKIIKN